MALKGRSVADPSIGVGDLKAAMESYLDGNHGGVKDFSLLYGLPGGFSWKSSPCGSWLASLSPLWLAYLKVAGNAVLPPKKHRQALEKLLEQRSFLKLASDKKTLTEWADKMDETIRIGMGQLRALRNDQQAKLRAFRKIDAEEQVRLDEVLSLVKDGRAKDEEDSQGLGQAEAAGASDSRALVPLQKGSSHDSLDGQVGLIEVKGSPAEIFQRVLEKGSGDEAHPTPTRQVSLQRCRSSPKSTGGAFKQVMSTKTAPSLLEQIMGMSGVQFDLGDEAYVSACETQKPINEGFKSQLQRCNRAQKEALEQEPEAPRPKAKAKAKAKGQAKAKAKAQAKASEKKKPKASAKKRAQKPEEDCGDSEADAEEASPAGEDGNVTPPAKRAKLDGKEADVPTEKVEKQTCPVPAGHGFDAGASRALNRKRYTSRKWHQAYVMHADISDLEQRKEKARQASQEASAYFESVWPKGWKPSGEQGEGQDVD